MRQAALIALYGQKPKELENLVARVWHAIGDTKLRRVFRPYDMRQVHGTIIGMEKVPGYGQAFNLNRHQSSGSLTEMRFDTLRRTVCSSLPIKVQIGGFAPAGGDFTSFGKEPYPHVPNPVGDKEGYDHWLAFRRLGEIAYLHEAGVF